MYIYRYSCKVPAILVRFYWNLNILDRFSKNTQISTFMKTRPVRAELFHANGRTDMMKLIVAFSQFHEHARRSQLWISAYWPTVAEHKQTNNCFMLICVPSSPLLLVIGIYRVRGRVEFLSAFDFHWSWEKDGFNEVYDVPVRLPALRSLVQHIGPFTSSTQPIPFRHPVTKTLGFSK